jgi:hypothetical protein
LYAEAGISFSFDARLIGELVGLVEEQMRLEIGDEGRGIRDEG